MSAGSLNPHDAWAELDEAWRVAFEQAWDAFCTGNIAVGAAASAPEGAVLFAGRNRVTDAEAPRGQLAGTSLAHAEMNVLAQVPFRRTRELVLTTTLQPCLQCSAAIRMAPIAAVRIGGADCLWDGCQDFTSLTSWVARRQPVPTIGPRRDELGVFGTLLSRFGPGLIPVVEEGLRERGEGPLLDLNRTLDGNGWCDQARSQSVEWALGDLWPQLRLLARGWNT